MSAINIRAIRSFRAIQEEAKKRFPAFQLKDPAFRNAIRDFVFDRLMAIEESELRLYALEEARKVM
jgi:hypothetical protein